jgi:hypothetical protein
VPAFTTRVELHHADNDDYETLHAAMEERGFSRFITSEDGITYHLPTAEYDYNGNETRAHVLGLAKAAANETGKKYAVLVTQSNGRSWHGLARA